MMFSRRKLGFLSLHLRLPEYLLPRDRKVPKILKLMKSQKGVLRPSYVVSARGKPQSRLQHLAKHAEDHNPACDMASFHFTF